MTTTITLYRAADSDSLPADCAAFARDRAVAETYLANPGFGGRTLWAAEVTADDAEVLDLQGEADAVGALCERTGLAHPGSIGADEWIPRDCALQDALRARGICWVVVRESYPVDAETWLWIGPWDREPEMEAA